MPNLLSVERVCLFGVIFTGFCKNGRVPDADAQSQHPGADAAIDDKARQEAELERQKALAEGLPLDEVKARYDAKYQAVLSELQNKQASVVLGSVHPDNHIYQALQSRPGFEPYLARIYAISYEGGYYILPRPTVSLVHGRGADPEQLRLAGGGPEFLLQDLTAHL